MIDYDKIKELNDKIKVYKTKLSVEDNPTQKEKLRKDIRITELKIMIERLK
jgi:hypothetical protein